METTSYSLKTPVAGRDLINKLIEYLVDEIRYRFKNINSIIVQGSAAWDEYTLFSDDEQDILLGNIGLFIITNSSPNRLTFIKFKRFLKHINRSNFSKLIERPLVLVKPFEINVISVNDISDINPDLWVLDMVKAQRILYGENILSQFKTNFDTYAGLKMILSRLFGLNLCIPLLANPQPKNKLEKIILNYESVKGIFAALESLLVLNGNYAASYRERSIRSEEITQQFSRELDDPSQTLNLFKSAARFKLEPNKLEQIEPLELWYGTRRLLFNCLQIYESKGYTLESYVIKKYFDLTFSKRFKRFFEFLINGNFEPHALVLKNPDAVSLKLMLKNTSNFNHMECDQNVINSLLAESQRANYLYCRGEWRKITDNILFIYPT